MSRSSSSHHGRRPSGRWDNSEDWGDNKSPASASPTNRRFFSHSYRDRDDRDSRNSRDYPDDRDRRPREPDHGRDSPISRATQAAWSRTDVQPDKKSVEKAEADIAKLLWRSHNVMVDQVKWSTKKDHEYKVFQRRESDYKRAGESRFPAIVESMERHRASWKKQEEVYDNELAKVEALRDQVHNNLAHKLVECLPVGEIKTRQIVDSVKQDVQKLVKETTATVNGRVETLEKEVLSLKESRTGMLQELAKERENTAFVIEKLTKEKESQAPILKNLTQERESLAVERKNLVEEQKTLVEEHKRQATLLNDLAKQVESMRSRDKLSETQAKSIESLSRDNTALRTQVSELQAQVSSLKSHVERVDTQTVAFTQAIHSQATVDANKAEKLADLERRVNDYGSQIADFNFEECSDVVKKVLVYPSWESLETRLKQLNSAIQEQIGNVKRGGNDNKDISDVKKELDGKFADLSKKLISFIQEYSSRMKEDTDQFDNRLKALEADKNTVKETDQTPTVSVVAGVPPPQEMAPVVNGEAISARFEVVTSEITHLRHDLDVWRNEVDLKCAANEAMILNLDKQFQNITTQDMARIILDHLKKIPPFMLSPDMQNFHERLARVETWQSETQQRQIPLRNWTAKVSRHMPDDMRKRGAPDGQHQNRQDKRARVENGAQERNGLPALG